MVPIGYRLMIWLWEEEEGKYWKDVMILEITTHSIELVTICLDESLPYDCLIVGFFIVGVLCNNSHIISTVGLLLIDRCRHIEAVVTHCTENCNMISGPLEGGTLCFNIDVLTHVVHEVYNCTCISFD